MDAADYRQQLVTRGTSAAGSGGDSDKVVGSMWADDVLAALLHALTSSGLLDNTLVIAQMDHGVGERNTLKEGGARIHMAAHWPARITAGSSINAIVSNIDLTPTLLEAAGVQAPDAGQIDGVSWLPLLGGGSGDSSRVLFVEDNLDRSVVSGCEKLIDLDADSRLLKDARFNAFRQVSTDLQQRYNVCTDTSEQTPLANSETLQQLITCHDTETAPTSTASFGTCTASTTGSSTDGSSNAPEASSVTCSMWSHYMASVAFAFCAHIS
jgi:hypothetical protein